MAANTSTSTDRSGRRRRPLRSGFSTGTAATAAARAALRFLLAGTAPGIIAVRLPVGYYLPIAIRECLPKGGGASAAVMKDGGDDPDVTDGAELRARVRILSSPAGASVCGNGTAFHGGICLFGGKGVGIATKPGLPVGVGEPAINPVPREMLVRNLSDELLLRLEGAVRTGIGDAPGWRPPARPYVLLPFGTGAERLKGLVVEVELEVPKGEALARRTLNPRLGVVGGISILGTTGLVKPFSHKAYEETIDVALSVAASSGCSEVVLTTGGKSEHFAREALPHLQAEAFVQIADFFGYAVRKARDMGFGSIVHSAFFGKVVKMAQGHPYTHAHEVPLDLGPLARLAEERATYGEAFCHAIATANTARHALEIIMARNATDVIEAVGRQALEQSARIAGVGVAVRLLLFDYNGDLLADIERE